METKNKTGRVITFYSFKGGVGRSMALANVAILLAKWNYKVLVVDWDLEAPGLENFYKDYISLENTASKPGLIDLLITSTNDGSPNPRIDWRDCLVQIDIPFSRSFQLDLITAGTIDDAYYERVRSFDFDNFYKNHSGSVVIEKLRNDWKANYDFVLIDSRTGVTDIGGICTVQFPDILVILFTPTQQSLQGVKRVAEKAMKAQRKLPYERINLLTLPVPTRIDNTEYKLSNEWFEKFETELKGIYESWVPRHENFPLKEFLLNSKIPYIAYFSYGEKLPVMEPSAIDPTSMGFSYESVALLLANQLDYPDLLLTDRKALIQRAMKKQEGIEWERSPVYFVKKGVNSYLKLLRLFLSYRIPILLFIGLMFLIVVLFTYIQAQQNAKLALKSQLLLDSVNSRNRQLLDSFNYLRKIDSIKNGNVYLPSPGEKALQRAMQELDSNAKSTIPGKHTGHFVAKYNDIIGLGEGFRWAATFVSWCYNLGQAPPYFQPNGSIVELEKSLIAKQVTYELKDSLPKPGDIYFYDWHGERAVGLVERYSSFDDTLTGIEGNSSKGSKPPYDEVARVKFSKKELMSYGFRFVRIK